MAVLGFPRCVRAFSRCGWGRGGGGCYLRGCAQVPHIALASLVAGKALGLWASLAVVQGSVTPRHVGESSWVRDRAHVPCTGRWMPIHRTTSESKKPPPFKHKLFW